jgi:hypothetical protein
VISSHFDATHGLCAQANQVMVFDKHHGFLFGPRHPDADVDQRGR